MTSKEKPKASVGAKTAKSGSAEPQELILVPPPPAPYCLLPQDLGGWKTSKKEVLLKALSECPRPFLESMKAALERVVARRFSCSDSFVAGLVILLQLCSLHVYDLAMDVALTQQREKPLRSIQEQEIPLYSVVSYRTAIDQACLWFALNKENADPETLQPTQHTYSSLLFGLQRDMSSKMLAREMRRQQKLKAEVQLVEASSFLNYLDPKFCSKNMDPDKHLDKVIHDLQLFLREVSDITQTFPTEEAFLDRISELPEKFEPPLLLTYEVEKLKWANSQYAICFAVWRKRGVDAKKDFNAPETYREMVQLLKLMASKLGVVPNLSPENEKKLLSFREGFRKIRSETLKHTVSIQLAKVMAGEDDTEKTKLRRAANFILFWKEMYNVKVDPQALPTIFSAAQQKVIEAHLHQE